MTTQDQAADPARTALARFGSRAYEKPSDVTNALTQLADHFVVVAPGGTTSCAVVAEGYKALVTAVVARRPEKDDKGKDVAGTGDVYMDSQTKQWCFHAAFLKKLAAGVGIEWLAEKTRRLDNFSHPFVCSIVVAGRYRDYSGELREISGSHMVDLRDEAAHGMTEGQLRNARRTIQQLAETKAKSRAIADACVSRTIADRDLDRPIICAKLYAVAPTDPKGAAEKMYGKGGGDGIDSAKQAEIIDQSTGEVTQGKSESPGPSTGHREPPLATGSPASVVEPKPFIITKGKDYAEEGRTFEQASSPALKAYLADIQKRFNEESATWTPKGLAGAKAKIAAAEAELRFRESVEREQV